MADTNKAAAGGTPPPAAEAGTKPAATDKSKGFAYRCVRKCTYKGKLVREGETIVLEKKEEVPHFEPVN
jgi:hypothetical protein